MLLVSTTPINQLILEFLLGKSALTLKLGQTGLNITPSRGPTTTPNGRKTEQEEQDRERTP